MALGPAETQEVRLINHKGTIKSNIENFNEMG